MDTHDRHVYDFLYTQRFLRTAPLLGSILLTMRFLTLKQKTSMLTYCRIQLPPSINEHVRLSTVGCDLITIPGKLTFGPDFQRYSSLSEIMELLHTAYGLESLSSPFIFGLLSSSLRCEAISPLDYDMTCAQSLSKEMSAALIQFPDTRINWNIFFFREPWIDRRPLLPGGKVPEICGILREDFERYRNYIKKHPRVLFPRVSHEMGSLGTVSEMERIWPGITPISWKGVSSCDLLYHYYRHGERVIAKNELRMAWKYGDLKPRWYYAYGATEFYASMYIKSILDDLVAIPHATNPKKRYDLGQFSLTSHNASGALIYDYSSFTTGLSALYAFCTTLAEFFEDVEVDLFDVHYGLHRHSLKELFLEYRDACLTHSMFELRGPLAPCGYTVHQQENGGMLGVQGNIALSTLAHGLFATAVLDDDALSVVGDDALMMTYPGTRPVEEMVSDISQLARINQEKFIYLRRHRLWEEGAKHAYQFLKRPVVMWDAIYFGFYVEFPLMAYALDSPSDPRMRFGSFRERRRAYVSQVQTMLWSYGAYLLFDSHVRDVIQHVLRQCYRKLSLRARGGLPGHIPDDPYLTVPPITDLCRASDWDDYLWELDQSEAFTMPVEYTGGGFQEMLEVYPGKEFLDKDRPVWTVLEGLGVMKKMLSRTVHTRTIESRFKFQKWLRGELGVEYTFQWLYKPRDVLLDAVKEVLALGDADWETMYLIEF